MIVAAGKFSWADADNQLRSVYEALSDNLNEIVFQLKGHSAISMENENKLRQKLFIALILSAVLGLSMMYAVLRLVIIKLVKPIQALNQAVEKVKRGDFQVRFKSDEKDEISQVGFAFNEMVKTLQQGQEDLRARSSELEDSVNQLQSLNKVLVGRELKMMELKEKIKSEGGKISRKRGSGKVNKSA
jgi:nitrate/nitrite-specific signal transduction histidine kinase